MSEWEKFCQRLLNVEKNRRAQLSYLSQFWIWRPYVKPNLTEQELFERGFENLGNINSERGKHNES